jgi:molybdopterin/thiamine biosynthesis adenylyltransferase
MDGTLAMSEALEHRYSRQVLFSGIGAEGQRRLGASRVAVVGCGATGSVSAALLARSGVGFLRIIDRDYVEFNNLQRQNLFDESDAHDSLPKAIAAARKLAAFNSQITVEPEVVDLTPENIDPLLTGVDLIVDGTDNFETRYLVNDFAVQSSTPWIYVAAVGSYAVTMNILPGRTACLACLLPESPRGSLETCDTAGVLNSAVGAIASLAASEAVKILVGAHDRLRFSLLSLDVWTNHHSELQAAHPSPGCRACVRRDFVHLAGRRHPHITLCGRNSVQIHERDRAISFAELGERLKRHGTVRHNEFVLKFWREPYELTLFPDGRAIIKGTADAAVARDLYARYIGN